MPVYATCKQSTHGQFMPLVNSQPTAVNVTKQFPSTIKNGDEELSGASIIQPVQRWGNVLSNIITFHSNEVVWCVTSV